MKTITQKEEQHAAACGSENKNCYICISEESEGSYPDTLFETLPPNAQATISELVKKVIDAKRTNSSTDTSAIEKQIDELVYQVYELSKDDIKIIEQ